MGTPFRCFSPESLGSSLGSKTLNFPMNFWLLRRHYGRVKTRKAHILELDYVTHSTVRFSNQTWNKKCTTWRVVKLKSLIVTFKTDVSYFLGDWKYFPCKLVNKAKGRSNSIPSKKDRLAQQNGETRSTECNAAKFFCQWIAYILP